MDEQLEKVREEIDEIDHQLLSLLAQRIERVRQIGQHKKKNHLAPLQSSRWKEVLADRVHIGKKHGLSAEWITRLWEAIHEEALRIEENI